VRFVRDVAGTAGTRVIQAVCAMVAGILVARLIGPTGNGTLSVLVALGGMAVLLGSLGLHYATVYFMGRFKEERDRVISNAIVVGVVGGLVSAGALTAVALPFDRKLLGTVPHELFFIYLAVIPCAYFNMMARNILLSIGRVAIYNVPDLLEGTGLIAGTALLLAAAGRHLGPLVGLRVAIEVSVTVFLVLQLRRTLAFRFKPSRRVLQEETRYGLRNYAASVLWVLLLQSDVVLCNYFLGRGPTGVYSIAVSLGLPVTLLSTVVGLLTFQRVSTDESRPTRIANTNRTLRLMVPMVGGLAAVAAALAPLLVPLIYGDRFRGAATALIILLPGLFVLSLETVMMNFLGGEGSPAIVYQAPIVGLVANFVVNLFVIPRYGINGAATTSSACYAIVYVLVLVFYLRWTKSSLKDVVLVRTRDLRALMGVDSAATHAAMLGRE
jgi:O-antigen/teichoic acid export membrane protein